MRAVVIERFGETPHVAEVADPSPPRDGVVVRVLATGICRSDWHAWKGHDPDVRDLPHVPGHELAGVVEATGPEVRHWKPGDRVTVPFACGCGTCEDCRAGHHQVCTRQWQPGFSGWGSFAEFVALPRADTNLVALPEALDFASAAALGCRFATAFHALVDQARVRPGEWLVIHGCGGAGLSAVAIGRALGCRVIAVDPKPAALGRAEVLGAEITVRAGADAGPDDSRGAVVVEAVRAATGGLGADVSLDTAGSAAACAASIRCLRPRGRHVQVGLLLGRHADPPLPMGLVIARELQLLGSHGMSARRYPGLLELVADGRADPGALVTRRATLDEAGAVLASMDHDEPTGITVIDRFGP